MAKVRHAEIYNGALLTAAGEIEFIEGVAEITDEQAELLQKHPVSDIRVIIEKATNTTPPTETDDGTDAPTDAPNKKAPPNRKAQA